MRIKQFKEVIQEVADAHQCIAQLCNRLSHKVDTERVKILLSHLEKKQQEAQQHLLSYCSQAPEGVLESWLEFAFEQPFSLLCQECELSADTQLDDVIIKIGQLEQKLIDMLSTIAEEAASEECDAVFHDLLRAEKNRVKELVHSCHRAEDI